MEVALVGSHDKPMVWSLLFLASVVIGVVDFIPIKASKM